MWGGGGEVVGGGGVQTVKRLTRQASRQTPSTGLRHHVLPSTTAVFSYAIGSKTELSANEQFSLCRCSNSSKFVTNNSNKTRRVIYSRQQSLRHQHR